MTKTICRFAILTLLSFVFSNLALAQDTKQLDEYMKKVTDAGFSGTVLVGREGVINYAKGFGLANRELDVRNRVETKFRLGSITKQFTAASIMLLQERGKLSTSDKICKYFETCPPAWSEITLHHLLSHTSGIHNYTAVKEYGTKMANHETVDSMIARFKDMPLDFQPGEKWNYSNSGYFLLGYVIEKVSGTSYENFIQQNIFDKLGMRDTGYDHFETILKNRATGYSKQPSGIINSPYLDMNQPYSAGSLYSTVEDLFKWAEAFFGDRLLTAKSREAMTTVVKNDYGYGLGISTVSGRTQVSHGGGINGFNTWLATYPKEKITVVVLRNADFGTPGPGKIGTDLVTLALGEKLESGEAKPAR